MSSPTQIGLEIFGLTDVGQIREHNEDNFLIADLSGERGTRANDGTYEVKQKGFFLGVCDGMGGAAAGEVASQLAVDVIFETLAKQGAPGSRDELARRLVASVERAGYLIYEEARADRDRRGMGTTATVGALVDSRLFIAQVGDSRAYILRDGQLVQVTRDQSLVNQLIEAGQLTEEEAENFEHNNIILQALGTADTVQVDLTYADLRQDDTVMFCSDGLSGMIRSDDIRRILSSATQPKAACRELIALANQAGGHDNITVIVAKVEAKDAPTQAAAALCYRKYLVDGGMADATIKAPAVAPDSMEVGEVSEEAARESRSLKVGHTMLGMQSPFSEDDLPPFDPEPRTKSESLPEIPTRGLPPSVVGFLIVSAMLIVTVMGFFLFR